MAKKMWMWSDGVNVHRGYKTKKAALAAARDALSIMGAHGRLDATFGFKVSGYHDTHQTDGVVGRYSLPSNGADSNFNTMRSIQHDFNTKRAMRDKPDVKQLRQMYTCDSCGARVHTVVRYADLDNYTYDYYGCPDTSCAEETPREHMIFKQH